VHMALADLTGGQPTMVAINDAAVRPAVQDGSLFLQLVKYVRSGYLLGAGSPDGTDTETSAAGVVQARASGPVVVGL